MQDSNSPTESQETRTLNEAIELIRQGCVILSDHGYGIYADEIMSWITDTDVVYEAARERMTVVSS